MLVLFTLFVINTELAFATVTVRVTDFPAALVCALAVMLAVVAVEGCTVPLEEDELVVVAVEGCTVPLEEDEPLPHAERNRNVTSTKHRVTYLYRTEKNACIIMTPACPIQLLYQLFVRLCQPSG